VLGGKKGNLVTKELTSNEYLRGKQSRVPSEKEKEPRGKT